MYNISYILHIIRLIRRIQIITNLEWYVDGDQVADDWHSSVEEWVYDDPGNYLDEDDKEEFDEDIFNKFCQMIYNQTTKKNRYII